MAYCTSSDIKAYLGITETADDALIEQSILAAKKAIDQYCNTSFDVATDTTRYYDSTSDLISGRSLHLNRHTLASPPTTVVVGGVDVTTAVKTYGNAPYWELVLSGTSGYSWRDAGDGDPEDAIAITGKWGYSTTPPEDVKQAAIIWSAHFYQIKDAAPDGTLALSTQEQQQRISAIPSNVVTLLASYRSAW